jgi:hypothetical protein
MTARAIPPASLTALALPGRLGGAVLAATNSSTTIWLERRSRCWSAPSGSVWATCAWPRSDGALLAVTGWTMMTVLPYLIVLPVVITQAVRHPHDESPLPSAWSLLPVPCSPRYFQEPDRHHQA